MTKIRASLGYPIVIASLGILGVGAMLWFFLPRMLEFTLHLGGESDPILLFLNRACQIVTDPWVAFIGLQAFVFIIVALWTSSRTRQFAKYLDFIALHNPISKNLTREIASFQFCSGLVALLTCGCPLVSGLKLVANTLSNSIVAEEVMNATKSLAVDGLTLGDSLDKGEVFPASLVKLISCAEEAGAMEKTLKIMAHYFEERIDERLEQISVLIEPAVLLILGVTVGVFSLLFFLPITKVISNL